MGVGRGSACFPDVTSRSHHWRRGARIIVVSFRCSTIVERFPHRKKLRPRQNSPLLICTLPPTLLIVPLAHSISSYVTSSKGIETGPTARAGPAALAATTIPAAAAADAKRRRAARRPPPRGCSTSTSTFIGFFFLALATIGIRCGVSSSRSQLSQLLHFRTSRVRRLERSDDVPDCRHFPSVSNFTTRAPRRVRLWVRRDVADSGRAVERVKSEMKTFTTF